ncbi:uncharacterized protein LOC116059278 [Xyrichtys novacula]|uniref:Uncharacterized protein LOC116059278 n=1 Tax=Xyrichtys novacula TaxID=13765 RepID=A0AAV1HEM3_XYRNO|nr:uncharacterized protein LOC116059278 [Xyrichtys novacula]
MVFLISNVEGVFIGAGVGQENYGHTELRGPSLGLGMDVGPGSLKYAAKAEIVSVSAHKGPVKATLSLAADSAVGIGPTQQEAKSSWDLKMSGEGNEIVKNDLGLEKYRDCPERFNTDAYAGAGGYSYKGKEGAFIGAGVGQIRDGDTELRGPAVGLGIEQGPASSRVAAKAEIVSVSAHKGPAKVTVGLAADSALGISPTQLEAKVLGTGVSFGRTMGFSVLGSGFEFKLW